MTEITNQNNPSILDVSVLNNYEALQKSVENMDSKVELIIRKHESEFLYAYRTHIIKIKKELEEIKRKSEQQQKMFSSNDRIRYLQKEVALFREETIKLYEKLQKKNFEVETLKKIAQQCEMTSNRLESENRELLIKIKTLEANRNGHHQQVSSLKFQIANLEQKIASLSSKQSLVKKHKKIMEQAKGNANVNVNVNVLRKSPIKQIKTYRSQLQQWFIECIKSVKKEINQRKNNFEEIDLSCVKGISEFKLIDKLRLFELILENEKLLNWLYHRMFPDRIDRIGQYLEQCDNLASQRYVEELPKVLSKRSGTSLRKGIQIKNGRMNISVI